MDVTATEFKIHCLDLLDRVNATGEVLRITKRGKVVAELHPPSNLAPAVPSGYGLLASVGRIHGDIVAPIDNVDWENLRELTPPSVRDAASGGYRAPLPVRERMMVAETSRVFDEPTPPKEAP
ncbi:MAG: type II toxin-antitoxin system prevent-host-death family antitoxin [Fimbriimonadaceae bacterium]|nr:type II toxin-antitoxin system prevent-host-death family antitoxin [Fimbriimonadaceae bacterium]